MKKILLFIAAITIFSCGKDKVVLLPEISQSEITEIQDVSPAYLFYDETQKDSIELNRKNLISTTNWLVNVDKRLTLKQVIPHIKSLQEKKSNSSHKNKKSKNYFTCNDTSKKNLGFVEFTDVIYTEKRIVNILADNHLVPYNTLIIYFESLESMKIISFFDKINITHSNIQKLNNDIISLSKKENTTIKLCFDKNLTFKNYILIKSVLLHLINKEISISKEEFISN